MKSVVARVAVTLLAGIGLMPHGRADAQLLDEAEPKNVSVRQRPHPEYDAIGIPVSSFRLFPELSVSGEYDDNIYASSVNSEDDVIGDLAGRFRLASQWSSNSLNVSGGFGGRAYAENDEFSYSSFDLGADGRLDIDSSSSVSAGLRYESTVEPLTQSPTTLTPLEPVAYEALNAFLSGVKSFNRLQLSGRLQMSSLDYDDAKAAEGGIIEQDDRDRLKTELGVRLDYTVSPDTGLYFNFRANDRDFDVELPVATIDRDSKGYEALVGATFDLSDLLRGEIGIGFLSQSYEASAAEDPSGIALRANVEWFADKLVTVTMNAARSVGDAGVSGAAGYISTEFGLRADYEFRRNIIFSASTGYADDDYQEIDRRDSRWNVSGSVDYALNRKARMFASVEHLSQSSEGARLGREYDVNQVKFGLKFQL